MQATTATRAIATSAYGGPIAVAMPAPTLTTAARPTAQSAGGLMAGRRRMSLTIDDLGHHPLFPRLPPAAQAADDPGEFGAAPEGLKRKKDRRPDQHGRGDRQPRADGTSKPAGQRVGHQPRGSGHEGGTRGKPGQRRR